MMMMVNDNIGDVDDDVDDDDGDVILNDAIQLIAEKFSFKCCKDTASISSYIPSIVRRDSLM